MKKYLYFQRYLPQFYLKASLQQSILIIRVRLNEDKQFLLTKQIAYQNLSDIWKHFFSNIQQIYQQLKIIDPKLLLINDSCELVYVVPLGSKKIYLVLCMQKQKICILTEIQEQLRKSKELIVNLYCIIDQKNEIIEKLTNQITSMKENMGLITSNNNENIINRSNQILQSFVNESQLIQSYRPNSIIDENEQNSRNIKLQNIQKQNVRHLSLVNSESLWNFNNKTLKNKSIDDVRKYLNSVQSYKQFNFIINKKCQNSKYFGFDNGHLRLKKNLPPLNQRLRFYTVYSQNYISEGYCLIKINIKKCNGHSMIFGLKSIKNGYNKSVNYEYQPFSSNYNIVSGKIITCLQNNQIIEDLQANKIEQGDKFEVLVNIQKYTIKFFQNKMYLGSNIIHQSLKKHNLLVYIKLTNIGDQIQFL